MLRPGHWQCIGDKQKNKHCCLCKKSCNIHPHYIINCKIDQIGDHCDHCDNHDVLHRDVCRVNKCDKCDVEIGYEWDHCCNCGLIWEKYRGSIRMDHCCSCEISYSPKYISHVCFSD